MTTVKSFDRTLLETSLILRVYPLRSFLEVAESTPCSSCFGNTIIASDSFKLTLAHHVDGHSGFTINGPLGWSAIYDRLCMILLLWMTIITLWRTTPYKLQQYTTNDLFTTSHWKWSYTHKNKTLQSFSFPYIECLKSFKIL